MKKVKLNWSTVDPSFGVLNYHVHVGKSPDTMDLYTGINAPPMILYPDQMGFLVGDTLYAAISAVNARGEGLKTPTLSVVLLAGVELPPAPDNFTIELVD